MDHSERIKTKLGVIFEIVNKYLNLQLSSQEAKEQINIEMLTIRPAQYEAFKIELGERIKATTIEVERGKLFDLLKNYISPPYLKLENGHPLANYFKENSQARDYLVQIDEMEGQEVILDDWCEIYDLLSHFLLHIKRQERNLYPLLTQVEINPHIQKAKELGAAIISEIEKNKVLLSKNETMDFLYSQSYMIQIIMKYLDLEERFIFPNALLNLSNQDFVKLRKMDDVEGYAYFDKPQDFIPKEIIQEEPPKEENPAGCPNIDTKLLLTSLLSVKNVGLVYFDISGKLLYSEGEQITESDLNISENKIRTLIMVKEKPLKFRNIIDGKMYMFTYSLLSDVKGKSLGILKTKEDISESSNLSVEYSEEGTVVNYSTPIDASFKIRDLFTKYPRFRVGFFSLDEELEGLKGPRGIEILEEATVGMIAKSISLEVNEFIKRINELLKSYE